MKVKASTVKRRTKTGMSASNNAKPAGDQSFTITSRIKRPDIVREVAEHRNNRKQATNDPRSKSNTRNLGGNTKPRQKAYIPGGRKSSATIYWVLGGLGAFSMIMLIAVIIAVSGSTDTPQRVVNNTPSPVRRTKKPNAKYGPGSWADDPDVRAAIEGSTLYKNRKTARKNYKKDR